MPVGVYGQPMRSSILLLLLPLGLFAQHCGYDHASIIVVHAHRANSPTIEPRLRITLLDTNNL